MPMHISMDHIISITYHWHHYGVLSKSTNILTAGHHGHHTISMGGTFKLPPITTTTTMYGSNKWVPKECNTPYTTNTNKSQIQQ